MCLCELEGVIDRSLEVSGPLEEEVSWSCDRPREESDI